MSRPLRSFFILAYFFSWCAFIPLALAKQGIIASVPAWLHLAGAFGPMLSAVMVTAFTSGIAGLKELFGRMLRWRIGVGWWLVALFSPICLFMVSALINYFVTGTWLDFSRFGHIAEFPRLTWWAGWLVWTLTFGLGEETGWRGFALPRLQKRSTANKATWILGLMWAAWHIPTFFYNYELTVMSVLAFTVGILSGAVILTWLYNSTSGSLLAVIVWHGAYNTVVAGASGEAAALVTASIILAAILISHRFGPESFSHREKQTI
jgi:membrane protease YdiL (CAAX protease family)